MPPKISRDEVERRFTFHVSDNAKAPYHESIRSGCQTLAGSLVEILPDCRETSLAITALEEAMFWANAALARPPAER